jgi:hypothetical protein
LKVKNKKYKLNWAFEKELRSDFIAGYCTLIWFFLQNFKGAHVLITENLPNNIENCTNNKAHLLVKKKIFRKYTGSNRSASTIELSSS